MCGIAGIVAQRGHQVDAGQILSLTALVAHRGPDGEGTWFSQDRSVALGHRRLAIIDPGEGGHQPMVSTDARHVIVYNGEVYNFLELRRELSAEGATFHTESDTEVILTAWQAWGESMLHRFNGMWALAIHDTVSGDLFLARDRFGIKPLLYAATPKHFMFASEMRALVRSGLLDPVLDDEVTRRLLLDPFAVEGSARTLFNPVCRLQAGHCLWLRRGRVEIRRWWNTSEHLPDVPADEQERAEQFGNLFRDAVSLRMRSDVPIGTCLSGGFDSSAIVCTMATLDQAGLGPRSAHAWRHAFVASFPGKGNDERPQAEAAAAWAGVTPAIVEISDQDALTDIDHILDDLDDIYIGLPTAVWKTYRTLRQHGVLVTLDGHGADELMGGYRQRGQPWGFHLRNLIASITAGHPALACGADSLRAGLLMAKGHHFLRGGLTDLPPLLPLVGDGDILPTHWGGLNRRLYRMFHGTVLPTILRNFDRLSMAHGVEVRMPFMDWRLVAYVMALPDASKSDRDHSKRVARQAMAGRMPESIRMGVRKIGFNSPMPEWLNGPLTAWLDTLTYRDVPAFAALVDEDKLRLAVRGLSQNRAWDWQSTGRIWPYLQLKWMLANA